MTQPFITKSSSTVDILILANGPGEVTTWVRPVVRALLEQLGQSRISVILSPCPHATGKEAEICRSYEEVDRVQEAKYFLAVFITWKNSAKLGMARSRCDTFSRGR